MRDIGCETLFGNWLEEVEKTYNTDYKYRNISDIFKEIVSAIDNADAVVIEYTVPNFSSSHQINYALTKKKPTLVLRLRKDNPHYADSYLEALQSPYLTIKDYSRENYRDILQQFIGISKAEAGQNRYNIVLERKQKLYLDWAANKYSKSRSALIRELIDAKLQADYFYKKFLKL